MKIDGEHKIGAFYTVLYPRRQMEHALSFESTIGLHPQPVESFQILTPFLFNIHINIKLQCASQLLKRSGLILYFQTKIL
jgi:hypothetical protein